MTTSVTASTPHIYRSLSYNQDLIPLQMHMFSVFSASTQHLTIWTDPQGSTGTPKCVRVSHRAICTSSVAQARTLDINPQSRVCQLNVHTFDTSIADHFVTLTYGACIDIPSEDDRMNDVTDRIDRFRATFVRLTNSAARALAGASFEDFVTDW